MTVSSLNEARVAATLTPSLPFPSLFSSSWPSSASPAATRQQQLFCHAATCKFVDRSNSYPPPSLSAPCPPGTDCAPAPSSACMHIHILQAASAAAAAARASFVHTQRERAAHRDNKQRRHMWQWQWLWQWQEAH